MEKMQKAMTNMATEEIINELIKQSNRLARQREEMEREYKETYSMFEKRCKKYAEELASTKADLAEANYLIKKLLHEQLECGRPLPKGEKEDECKTEAQEAKEEKNV